MIRTVLARLGYVLWKRDFMRYGVDPFLDIQRLDRTWGTSVNTFFDVGANIGQTAQEALVAFPDARIFSFEPQPDTFRKLCTLSDPRLVVHPLALADHDGQTTFYEYASDGDGTQINSLVNDARFPTRFGYQAKETKVHCCTLDRFCAEQGVCQIDVLKLDTEGSELIVLKGAAGMLGQGKIRFVYTEYNDVLPELGTTGGSLAAIAEELARFGYVLVATYTDRVMEDELFVSSNALFARHR
jgi:FkbM family methyltransferase